MPVFQAFDSAESLCRFSSPGTGFLSELCLLQGWAEPLWHRLSAQRWAASPGLLGTTAWQGHQTLLRTARVWGDTQGWAQFWDSFPVPRCALCSPSRKIQEPVVPVLMFPCSLSCPAVPQCWRGSPGSSIMCFFWVGWPNSGSDKVSRVYLYSCPLSTSLVVVSVMWNHPRICQTMEET